MVDLPTPPFVFITAIDCPMELPQLTTASQGDEHAYPYVRRASLPAKQSWRAGSDFVHTLARGEPLSAHGLYAATLQALYRPISTP